ncbi:DNA-binding protein [Streptomyces sp. NPDC006510]|uniref:DNA-binding protein n=1 Tax=Streptomyces sp. NPDC006510 TaxID=3155600 RepID=UPI0033B98CC6
MSGSTAAGELLAAGAVLPPGTEGGERAVPLTARAYRHPGLEARTVVRLVPGELGAAEDLAAGFLGLAPAGEPEVVGLGLRQALGFPEWVLVHHPQDGHHALAVVPELERAARQAKSKPKAALDACKELAGRLAASVPYFLPTFYEQAGRVFLGVDNATYAAQMFNRARKAEAEHGLTVDEDRLDAVCLEFALAGVLPVKALSEYAKQLAARVPAEEALRRFVRLCVRRTAGGLPPSGTMAADLRRLAKAAGQDAGAVEQEYLAELLELPGTMRAATAWWKAHRPALVALARRDAAVRGTLLNAMPQGDEELLALWLEILEDSSAAAGLGDGEVPERERPADGTAGWFRRFLAGRGSGWRGWTPLPRLCALTERIADRLRAEVTASGEALRAHPDLDLLDLLLALRIPVADPEPDAMLGLKRWAGGEAQRDLLALAADTRFRPAFRRAVEQLSNQYDRDMVLMLAQSPGGRPMLAEWVRDVARRTVDASLPEFPAAVRRLSWLPGEALALAPDEVRQAVGTDRGGALARTLRAGLIDELGWPAWEQAVTELATNKIDRDNLVVADAWPYLIVSNLTQARVLGADGTVLTHDLRIPAGEIDRWNTPGFHYVDGELLVHWKSPRGLCGYWHTAADRIQLLQGGKPHGSSVRWPHILSSPTLPLPGGGRTTGEGVLHRGDTTLPGNRAVISDGTSYWVWQQVGDSGWYEYDPATGEYGRRAMPGFLTDAVRDAPADSTYVDGWLLPAFTDEPAPVGVPVGGLLGWRVVCLPDGSLRGEDLAGRSVTVPGGSDGPGTPARALTLPGDDRARALVLRWSTIRLIDPDGVITAEFELGGEPGLDAAGTTLLPPLRYWHCLRPRDPEGSAVLRRIDRDTAAALLKVADAAGEHEGLHGVVGELLPGITDTALVTGVAGVVRRAAKQQATLGRVAARLAETLGDESPQDEPAGPSDELLVDALSGLADGSYWPDGNSAFHSLMTIGQAVRGDLQPAPQTGSAVRTHLDGHRLPDGRPQWARLLDQCAAVAFRAAAPTTRPEHRDALHQLLRELDALGLAAAAETPRWRRFTLHLDASHLTKTGGEPRDGTWLGLLPLDGGALLAVVDKEELDEKHGCSFTALFHDPSGRFEVPAPYTLRSSGPVGEARDAGWPAAFLSESDARGPAPAFPDAAIREFARLTGVSEGKAALVVAGMPYYGHHAASVPGKVLTRLGLKQVDVDVALEDLRDPDARVRREVVAALLPAEPARLWTDGPDVAAAAEVWLRAVGRRPAAPATLVAETSKALGTGWAPRRALPALLDPAGAPELSRDLAWTVSDYGVKEADPHAAGFTRSVFLSTMTLVAWLSHRLPAADPVRAALPGALAAVRDRLAHPGLMLNLGGEFGAGDLDKFRTAAGTPTETGEDWERYGAVVLAGTRYRYPAVRPALLDAAGTDSYLPVLCGDRTSSEIETALRLARDPRFEAVLADPGGPVAGERDEDGTWWPQDPTRSVPDLVAEAAKEYGLGDDAAVLHLMLLAMPDPTDRNTARWTGWKPDRLKAAGAELAATELVVEAKRPRAGRSLFLFGGWVNLAKPALPVEQWKLPLFGHLVSGERVPLDVLVPVAPAADLYRRAWQRVRDGDGPRFEELKVPRRRGR